ncbi:hypothetical protein GCM10027184_75010 [Saccharothrix stipae]
MGDDVPPGTPLDHLLSTGDSEDEPLDEQDYDLGPPPSTGSQAGDRVSVTGPFTYLDSEPGEPPPVRGDTR